MCTGEHIDYCLFGVLPAAIEHDILIACGPRTSSHVLIPEGHDHPGAVVADNLHDKYTTQAFMPKRTRSESVSRIGDEEVHVEEWLMDINTKELRWESYVKAGYFVSLSCPSSSFGCCPLEGLTELLHRVY
jgi:hypothetical protein